MGSRGLPAKGTSGGPWKINKDNGRKYNITIMEDIEDDGLKKDIKEGLLNAALGTINRLNNELLGLSTRNAPNIEFQYGGNHPENLGDARFFAAEYEVYDAHINMYSDALLRSPDTAAHEYIHALTYQWIRNSFSTYEDRLAAYNAESIQEGIVMRALISSGYLRRGATKFERSVWKIAAGTVHRFSGDRYAQKNLSETLTTSVQMVLRYGNKASPFAKAVVRELRREARSQQRKISAKKSKK